MASRSPGITLAISRPRARKSPLSQIGPTTSAVIVPDWLWRSGMI
jgi:hypothetical protein